MGMMELRRQIITAKDLPPIPDLYQKVKYITKDDASAWMDTGVNGNNQYLRFEFCVEPLAWVAYASIFGNFLNGQDNSWRMIFNGNNDNSFLLAAFNKAADLLNILFSFSVIGTRMYVDFKYRDVSAVVKSVKVKQINKTLHDGSAADSNIAIGTQRVGQSVNGNFRYYYFRIYDNGDLIRNYVPCYRKADNAVGFYDTINNTFNPSTGSAQFTLS